MDFFPELIYSGQRLLESRPLTAYGLKPGSTVYVLQKRIRDEPTGSVQNTALGIRPATVTSC